jgi:hypothetical protein
MLIDGKQYEQCHMSMKGKKREHGGAHRSEDEGTRSFRGNGKRHGFGEEGEARPESDVAPGDGQLEAMTASRSGRRGKREPRRGSFARFEL